MRKLMLWVSAAPVVLILAIMAFSPSGTQVQPAVASRIAAQPAAPSALPPIARPVMYEFFTDW